MKKINITRNFKDLKISMCPMGAYSSYDMDYEFSITGNSLPMVRIGKITPYSEGGELILDNFEDATGSDIYATMSWGRVCQTEDDIYPSYTEIFEIGVDEGIYDVTNSKYTILNYDKDEIISFLFDMANECKREYVSTLNIKYSDVKYISKIIRGRVLNKREYTFGLRYNDDINSVVLDDEYGFGLCEIEVEKDMSSKDIFDLICNTLGLNLEDDEEEYGEDDLDHSLVKCCGTCTEYHINKKDGYSHCTHFGVSMDMFNVACRCYNAYPTTCKDRIEEILDVEEFTI